MSNSRRINVVLNIYVGLFAQIGILFLAFLGRMVFLHFLSVDYLGINGLYTNILAVLALAELGLGNVTQFFLYKPVAENNKELIAYMVKYFKKLYYIIAAVVLTLGLLLVPFLHFIINSKLQPDELLVYYVLFLLNSVVSYLSAHKMALLAAYQDNRLSKYVSLGINFVLQLVYIMILVFWQNYTMYVSATLLATIINVVLINLICDKRYPYLREKSVVIPSEFNRQIILDNVKSTFIYKLGATIVNNTDNILISIMINTAAVGLYSNYYMIVLGVQSFITIVTTSLISSVGNLSAFGNKEKMVSTFNVMLLFYNFIAAFGAISFNFLFEDLISIWIGNEFLLNELTVFAIAFGFYLTNAISPIWMFREANGMFIKVKYLFLITALLNILLSISLGHILGIAGILLATSIARLMTQGWYEPKILFSYLFEKTQFSYWRKQLKYIFLTVLSTGVCCLANSIMGSGLIFIFFKALAFFLICMMVFIIGCVHTREYEITKSLVKEGWINFRIRVL